MLIILGVVALDLFEVNIIEPILPANNFTYILRSFEGDIGYWFSQHWIPALLYFFVMIYIAVYPFTLWFSPIYFIITNNKKSMKTIAYGAFLIYIIALPFYLFFPVTNVYTYYHVESPLEIVIPSVENFFYSTTTQNNCFPSLHTAFTILIAYTISLTDNKRLKYFAYSISILVIISVIYLAIHWIMDVIAGIALSLGVILLLKKTLKE